MQNFLALTIKYIPQLLLSLLIIILQMLFINTNIIGVYLFGSLYTNNDFFRIFLTASFITLLYDSLKIANLGTWAVSYFSVAIVVEIILRSTKIRQETTSHTIRGSIFLGFAIAASAIAQMYLLKQLGVQTLATGTEFSIVILSILYVLYAKILSNNKSDNYLRM